MKPPSPLPRDFRRWEAEMHLTRADLDATTLEQYLHAAAAQAERDGEDWETVKARIWAACEKVMAEETRRRSWWRRWWR